MTEQQAQAPYEPQPQPQPQPQQYYQQQPPPPYRRLTRSSWDSKVSGVCGGVAHYLGVDPTLVRVLAAVAMVVTFPAGPILYAVMWAVMPRE